MAVTVIPLVYTPKGVRKPVRAEWYWWDACRDVQGWYKEKLGVTYDLGAPVNLIGLKTWDEIKAAHGLDGQGMWKAAIQEFIDRKGLKICRRDRAYVLLYLRPPLPVAVPGMGGMIGVENWGCDHDRPGTMLTADAKSWAACGWTRAQIEAAWGSDWAWWGDDQNDVRGSLAHELVHIFTDLPHSSDWGADTVTLEYWLWPACGFTPVEADTIRASGYLA